MKWYGLKKIKNKSNKLNNINLYNNLQTKSLNISIKSKFNLNYRKIIFFLPPSWNFYLLKIKNLNFKHVLFYFYNNIYFFFLPTIYSFNEIKFDKQINSISIKKLYTTTHYTLFWNNFKKLFYSFTKIFFNKIKFKGKGYYIYKNKRNTIAMQFGYSHKTRLFAYFIAVKFLSKTSVLFFGINKFDIIKISYKLKNTRSINIFTSKGIRFSRQIIYKKTGKISSYR